MPKRIGEKVKKLRLARNMTLKDLSEKAELSVSHLSQFERGIGSLSIYSLERVALALNVPLNDFMPSPIQQENKSYILRSYELNLVDVSYTGRYYNRLNNNLPESKLEPMLVILLPQERRKDSYPQPHPGEEFIYVIEGVLTVLIDSEEYTLYPGDSMHYLATSPHEWLNLTSQTVRLISVNTPRILSALTQSKSDEAQN